MDHRRSSLSQILIALQPFELRASKIVFVCFVHPRFYVVRVRVVGVVFTIYDLALSISLNERESRAENRTPCEEYEGKSSERLRLLGSNPNSS